MSEADAGKEAGKQKQADKQAGKQKQADKQAGKQAGKQAAKQGKNGQADGKGQSGFDPEAADSLRRRQTVAMLIVLSPAKALDFTAAAAAAPLTAPQLSDDVAELAKTTRKLTLADLRRLMSLSGL